MNLSQFEGLNVALGEFLQEAISVCRTTANTNDADWLLSEESAELDLFLYGLHVRGFRGMYAVCEEMSMARRRAVEARLVASGRGLPRGADFPSEKLPEHFEVYVLGIVCSSVCTNLPIEEATQQLNTKYPTGISSSWSLSDRDFADGTQNGCPCSANHAPGARHYLFTC